MAETPRATAVCQTRESTTTDPAEFSSVELLEGVTDAAEDAFPEGEVREARVPDGLELALTEGRADGEPEPEIEAEAEPDTEADADIEVGGAPVEEPPVK